MTHKLSPVKYPPHPPHLHHGHKQLASCGGVFDTQVTCARVYICVCICVHNVEESWRLT